MYTAGLVGSAMLGACSDSDSFADDDDGNVNNNRGPNGTNADQAIANFALNLEYLEAEFYLFAATGSGIPDNMKDGIGERGTVSGGGMVNFGNDSFGNLVREYANEIAVDEFDHVKTLRDTLGGGAVAEPRIALDTAFRTAASAAGLGDNFDYTASPTNFLLAAYIFEDVGVTAYKGAAPLITDPKILKVAAGFLAAEAYHASLVRTVLYAQATQSGNQDLFNAVKAISDARDALDKDGVDNDQGIAPTNDTPNGATGQASNIVPLMDNGEAYGRNPGPVLNIVYLNTDTGTSNGGGFFPDGVNSNDDSGLFTQGTAAASGSGGGGSS